MFGISKDGINNSNRSIENSIEGMRILRFYHACACYFGKICYILEAWAGQSPDFNNR